MAPIVRWQRSNPSAFEGSVSGRSSLAPVKVALIGEEGDGESITMVGRPPNGLEIDRPASQGEYRAELNTRLAEIARRPPALFRVVRPLTSSGTRRGAGWRETKRRGLHRVVRRPERHSYERIRILSSSTIQSLPLRGSSARRGMMPGRDAGGYLRMSANPASSVTKTWPSATAAEETASSVAPPRSSSSAVETECPASVRSWAISMGRFSSVLKSKPGRPQPGMETTLSLLSSAA